MKKSSEAQIETTLRHVASAAVGAVNPPVERASTILYRDLEHLERAGRRPFEEPFYGRFGTATHAALGQALTTLSGAAGTVLFPSGLAAIAGVLLSLLEQGDEVLVADCVYGPTRQFCDQDLRRFGVTVRYFRADIGDGIADLISDRTRLVLCESPGSLSMEIIDLPAICAAAEARGVPVAVDNTWATPLQCKVLDLGAAIDIQAGTKYIGGHADLMLGAALCRADLLETVRRRAQAFGYCVGADDAWLALRGLRTLDLRLRQHQDNAGRIKQWLRQQPECLRILDPSEPDDPGHAIWRRDFGGGNGLFSVELEPMSGQGLATLVDSLELFGLGYSWGGFESLCLPFELHTQRTERTWSADSRFLRFHIGLESPADLISDLEQAFARLRAPRLT